DSRISRIPSAERRRDDGGNTKAEQRFAVHKIGVHVVGGGGSRRRDMFEKTTPLVKIHNENRVGPLRALGHSFESPMEEQISFADVGVRMIVVAGAVVENCVPRIDEGNGRKRPGACSQEKFFVEARDAKIL